MLLHNEWHDARILNGPNTRDGDDERWYDAALLATPGVPHVVPERWLRRGPTAAGDAAPPPPADPTETQPKRFPHGCIVWARVKGTRDWAPAWVIEMPKAVAPAHLRHHPDAYYVELFVHGTRFVVEDSYEEPDIFPFDMNPPQSAAHTMFEEDSDWRIEAIQEALAVYFHGMSVQAQEDVLRWHGPLRLVHRILGRMNALWDRAARTEALELETQELHTQLEAATHRWLEADKELQQLRSQTQGVQGIGHRLSALNRVEIENLQLKQQVASLDQELRQLSSSQESRPAEVAAAAAAEGPRPEGLEALRAQRDQCKALLEESATALEDQTQAALSWQQRHDAVVAKLAASETQRQRLEYAVLELRGGLRVIGRVRPPSASEAARPPALIRFPEDDTLQYAGADGRCHTFKLDRVFQPAATNGDVYHEVAPLVQSVLDGYHVCIFTYGQTGSGKTWTLQGPAADPGAQVPEHDIGFIPKAMDQIFDGLRLLRADGWEHEVAVKMVEIYNEVVHDLLVDPPPPHHHHHPVAAGTAAAPHSTTPFKAPAPRLLPPARRPALPATPTRMGPPPPRLIPTTPRAFPSPLPAKRPHSALQPMSPQAQSRLSLRFGAPAARPGHSRIPVPGGLGVNSPRRPAASAAAPADPSDTIGAHTVPSVEAFRELLQRATSRRATGQTACNEQSSRSHFLCVVSVRGTNAAEGTTTHGLLNLVDLAGSERLSKSAVTGDRLKETQHINLSLFCLKNVIAALAAGGERFVPFRDSKLTWLLKDSLTNRAKVLTVVTLSPAAEAEQETLCSLHFAQKAHGCVLGPATRDVRMSLSGA